MGQKGRPGPRSIPARPCAPGLLLLFVLEAGDEHLLGPLGGRQVILEDPIKELHEFLVALRLGVLDVGPQRLDVVRGVVEHGDEVVVFVLGLPGRFGHLSSL